MDGHPLSGVPDRWEEVTEDMAATAAEFREAGWETTELHPGDVTPVPNRGTDPGPAVTGPDPGATDEERVPPGSDTDAESAASGPAAPGGLDVLVPDDEYGALADLVEGIEFDEYEAFRAVEGDVAFLVVAMQAPAARQAVLVPLYYSASDAGPMEERVRADGTMRVAVRPLSADESVVFTQEDPENLLPPDPDGRSDDDPARGATE